MSLVDRVRNKLHSIRYNRKVDNLSRRAADLGATLRNYQTDHLLEIHDRVGFANKTVLEIGGDLEGQTARGMLALGASHVTSINMDENLDVQADIEGVERRHMDARNLDLPAGSFDVAMGIAVLEHFLDFELVLANAFAVLKPGGTLFLQGGPMWRSARGHHLVVVGDDGRDLHFARGDNPVDDWSHLLLSEDEMRADLLANKGLSEAETDRVVHWVYQDTSINRVTWRDVLRACEASEFQVDHYRLIEGPQPSGQVAQSLAERFGDEAKDCGIAGMTVFLNRAA